MVLTLKVILTHSHIPSLNDMLLKIAEKMEQEREDDDSSEFEEDSDGELINEKVSEKFIETLAKIRQKDPSIYKAEKTFFKGTLQAF